MLGVCSWEGRGVLTRIGEDDIDFSVFLFDESSCCFVILFSSRREFDRYDDVVILFRELDEARA
jgi:hypothetical protein